MKTSEVRMFHARIVGGMQHILAIGWALKKGEWWQEDNEPKKLISFGSVIHDGVRRTGIYIGRLAIVHMQKARE